MAESASQRQPESGSDRSRSSDPGTHDRVAALQHFLKAAADFMGCAQGWVARFEAEGIRTEVSVGMDEEARRAAELLDRSLLEVDAVQVVGDAGSNWGEAWRFVVVVPLRTPSTSVVGALVLADVAPRAATRENEAALFETAAGIERLLAGKTSEPPLGARWPGGTSPTSTSWEHVGFLAAGVAHDVNNLMSVVIGNAGLCLRRSPRDELLWEYLSEIEAAAQQAADLSHLVLQSHESDATSLEILAVPPVAEDLSVLLRSCFRGGIRVEYRIESGVPAVRASRTLLRQVLINLVMNASDALGDQGGTVVVGVHATSLGPADLCLPFCGAAEVPGDFVEMEIRDDGPGMSPDQLRRAFQPGETSKAGPTHGLGLANVRSCVERLGGLLLVETAPGQGCRFRLLLPASDQDPAAAQPAQVPPTAFDRGGKILVIEGHAVVGRVVSRMVRQLGFDAILQPDPHAALKDAQDLAADLSAVLLDATFETARGLHLLEHIQALFRDRGVHVPVLIMSGLGDGELGRVLRAPPEALLAKPFSAEALGRALRRCLER